MLPALPLGRARVLTHLLLAIGTAAGCRLTALLRPDAGVAHVLTIGLGYVALVLGTATLLVGPLWLLRQRRNPVNIDLRRDIGIWVGITGIGHVVFGLQIHLGGQILLYFVEPRPGGYRPLTNLFGISNYVGAAATILLAMLLALSNDLSLRWLRSARWKLLQRFNYLLFVTTLAHTVGYQLVVSRARVMIDITVALVGFAVTAQIAGVALHRTRRATSRPAAWPGP
jgi:DMSO/TMAO reductase YedYZ heme-binding membrane subunit